MKSNVIFHHVVCINFQSLTECITCLYNALISMMLICRSDAALAIKEEDSRKCVVL